MGTFFKDDDFEFTTLLALGSTYQKVTDVGQRLSTLTRIKSGGYEGWYREWRVTRRPGTAVCRVPTPVARRARGRSS